MTNPDPLAGGDKAPALSFKNMPVGTTYTGEVLEDPKLVQARDFDSGDPAVWPDGNPKMAVVVRVNVNGEERSIWAPKPSAMFKALADAQKAAGKRITVGGRLTVKFVGEKPNERNERLNPQKLYTATYAEGDPFADDVPPF